MEKYISRMIDEHSQLVIRIQKLHNYVYSKQSDEDDKVEYANKCIQLSAMKKYEEALRARLENKGIFFENGQYVTSIAELPREEPETKAKKSEDENPPQIDFNE